MSHSIYERHEFDPLYPFILHEITLSNNPAYLPNWHKNLEILHCVDGCGEVLCDTTFFTMQPGDTLVINSDTMHHCITSDRFVYYCLIVDNSFCITNGINVEQLQFETMIRKGDFSAIFHRIVQAHRQYRTNKSPYHALTMRYEVLGLISVLCHHHLLPTDDSQAYSANQRIKSAIIYIRENLTAAITLDAVAAHVGISKYYLAREFRRFTGTTIIDFLNLTRCTEAKGLIESGMSVSRAAASCGYENYSYFTRVFKKHFGVLPSALAVKIEKK